MSVVDKKFFNLNATWCCTYFDGYPCCIYIEKYCCFYFENNVAPTLKGAIAFTLKVMLLLA